MPDVLLLRTEKLVRAYGSLLAVNGVDFSVREGELRSIIGPNGAGKTTFFRLISGEVAPTSGRIWFRDEDGKVLAGVFEFFPRLKERIDYRGRFSRAASSRCSRSRAGSWRSHA